MRTLIPMAALVLASACSDKAPAPAPAPASAPVATPAAAPAAAAPVPAGASAAPLLSDAGVGPIRFGMTLPQAQAAAGKASLPEPFDPGCSMVRFDSLPGLRFMVESGTITRADAGPGVDNALGVAVGDPVDAVRARHPGAVVSPHKYVENGQYLGFPSADGAAAIVLEAEGSKVTKIRAGRQPAVGYVETCG